MSATAEMQSDMRIETAERAAGVVVDAAIDARQPPVFIRGIAGPLPAGEHLLWEGGPSRASILRHAFHGRKVALYFAGLVVIRMTMTGAAGLTTFAGWRPVLILMGLGLAGVAVSHLLAALSAGTTGYAITDRRVVLRSGIVLAGVLNVPLHVITGASIKSYADGTGDLAITLGKDVRIAYLHLWPYVRAWRITRPEPALRGLADAQATGAVLRAALVAASQDATAADAARDTAPDTAGAGWDAAGADPSGGRSGVRTPLSGSPVAA
jgi:hypothetical protein